MSPDPSADWLEAPPPPDDEVMYVDVGGYEGPLDLLLDLARRQKVDLSQISVLALAEQYLGFIETVREKRIEIAADYLVMAAWLAYLKSRLMVPQAANDDEPTGEMMAALLQFRLKRLEAMRRSAMQLMNRPILGRQVFARGAPEPVTVKKHALWEASLFDLLKAYATQRERGIPNDYTPFERHVWSLQDAREILKSRIALLDAEIAAVEKRLGEAHTASADVDRKRDLLENDDAALRSASAALAGWAGEMEDGVRRLHPRLPEPAVVRIAPLFNRMPAEYRALVRYIFPGGELDHLGMSIANLERHGFDVHDVEGWREHYQRTTRLWWERLEANKAKAEAEIGPERTRMWLLYLAGCSLAFERGGALINQTLVSKRRKGPSGLPLTRADLYRA